MRILRVEAPTFVAGAVWVQRPDGWACVDAAPILRWMIGTKPERVKSWLDRRGFHYEWIEAQGK